MTGIFSVIFLLTHHIYCGKIYIPCFSGNCETIFFKNKNFSEGASDTDMKKIFLSLIFSVGILFAATSGAYADFSDMKTGDTLLFDFGNIAEYGWIQADASVKYTKERGYGWSMVSFTQNESSSGNGVLSDAVGIKRGYEDRVSFNVDIPDGMYEISVYSGNIRYMTIGLENHPAIINLEFENSEARVEIPVTDGQLNMTMMQGNSGTDLAAAAMTIKRTGNLNTRKKRIFVCSDSTAATFYPLFMYQPLEPGYRGGWGQMLNAYLSDSMYVHNLSSPGQSAKSFIESGRFESALYFMQPNDYAFIAFGINDAKECSAEEYLTYMTDIISSVKEKGGIPVIISQTPEMSDFNENDEYIGNDNSFCAEAEKIAADNDCVYIDMHTLSIEFFKSLGNDVRNDMYWTAWNGTKDCVHLSRNGAGQIARLIAEECSKLMPEDFNTQELNSALSNDLRLNCKTEKNTVYLQNLAPREMTLYMVTNNYRGGRLSKSNTEIITLPAFDVLEPYKTVSVYAPLYDSCNHIFIAGDKDVCIPLEWKP